MGDCSPWWGWDPQGSTPDSSRIHGHPGGPLTYRATPGSASPSAGGGGSPPEGNRSPTRGGVSREAPRMHPGSVDIPLRRTCAAHPESGTAPTGRHERRPHVGRGQPGLSGCVPAGDTGRAPRNCLQEECGLGTLRRGEIRRSQELLLPFLAPCLQHSRAPAPQLPGQPHGAAPHGAAPHGTGVLPVQPLMAPGCSQRSPPNRGGYIPTAGLRSCVRTPESGEQHGGGRHTHTRGPWLKSQSLSPHSRGRDSSTGTRLRAGTRGW